MMLSPIPLFSTVEWGTYREAGHCCAKCGTGRYEQYLVCDTCWHSFTVPAGVDVAECLCPNCLSVVTAAHLEGESVKLQCTSCGDKQNHGWYRKHYGESRPEHIRGVQLGDGPLFHTVQHFSDRDSMFTTGLHIADFVLDIDRTDFEESVEVTEAFSRKLTELGAWHQVYFSGSKGFHIVVPAQVVGAKPDPKLNDVYYKGLAKKLAEMVGHEPDWSIYTKLRMLRVANTRHGKTGLFKIPIGIEEIHNARKLALHPRDENRMFLEGVSFTKSLALNAMLDSVVTETGITRITVQTEEAYRAFTQTSHPHCVQQSLDVGAPQPGIRNRLTSNLAAYYAANGLPVNELEDWARYVPGVSTSTPGERLDDVRKAYKWASVHKPRFSCLIMKELGLCNPSCPFNSERFM